MSVLQWHDGLNVGVGFMDEDHAVAADLINDLAAADLAGRLLALPHFIEHCRDHFGREQDLMAKVRFFATACHTAEHHRVLVELDTVFDGLRAGDAQDGYFTRDLPGWLLDHRATMDRVTAEFAMQAGYHAA